MATEAGIPDIRTVQCRTPLKTGGGAGLTWNSEVPLGAHPHVLGIHLVTAVSPGGAQPGSLCSCPGLPRPTSGIPWRPGSPRELLVDAEVALCRGCDRHGGHQQVVLLAQEDLAVGHHGDHEPEA